LTGEWFILRLTENTAARSGSLPGGQGIIAGSYDAKNNALTILWCDLPKHTVAM